MEPLWLAVWSLPLLLVLIFLRVPIGLSMLVLGLGGCLGWCTAAWPRCSTR